MNAAAVDEAASTDPPGGKPSAVGAPAVAVQRAAPAAVLVKVGDTGKWSPFNDEGVATMDRAGLLNALVGSKMFGSKFTGVALSHCTVSLFHCDLSDGKKIPTASDEASDKAVTLKGVATVAEAAKAADAGTPLCIRVNLPRAVIHAGSVAARLLACLQYAKLEPIEGEPEGGCQMLALYDAVGNPVNWPKLRSNKLLIRPVFREFFERADMFNCGRRRLPRNVKPDTLVCGIPGIGKSSFALYCLWRLVTLEQRHVLYDYPRAMGSRESDIAEFGTGPCSKCVYIADGSKPRVVGGITLLVASSRADFVDEFREDARAFFMPELTDEEIHIMRHQCFADCKEALTDGVVADRLLRWGNVPRMVLGDDMTDKHDLEATLDGLTQEPLRRKLEGGSLKDVADFRAVHYKFSFDTAAPYRWWPGRLPSRNYAEVTLRWATAFMEDHARDVLREFQRTSSATSGMSVGLWDGIETSGRRN